MRCRVRVRGLGNFVGGVSKSQKPKARFRTYTESGCDVTADVIRIGFWGYDDRDYTPKA